MRTGKRRAVAAALGLSLGAVACGSSGDASSPKSSSPTSEPSVTTTTSTTADLEPPATALGDAPPPDTSRCVAVERHLLQALSGGLQRRGVSLTDTWQVDADLPVDIPMDVLRRMNPVAADGGYRQWHQHIVSTYVVGGGLPSDDLAAWAYLSHAGDNGLLLFFPLTDLAARLRDAVQTLAPVQGGWTLPVDENARVISQHCAD